MAGKMDNITGKMVIIRNIDDMTQITTKTITCNITGNTTMIKNTDIAGRMSSRINY